LQFAECTCRKKKLHGGLRGATLAWCAKSPLHASNSATASPQNQLQLALAEYSRKNLHGGLRGDMRGWRPKVRSKLELRCKACHARNSASAASAKSIAASQLHPPKNLRGGLRGGMQGTLRIPTSLLLYRIRSSAKSIVPSQIALAKKSAEKFACCIAA